MKTASLLTLLLAAGALQAKPLVPTPQEDPRARTGKEIDLGSQKVTANTQTNGAAYVPGMTGIDLSAISLHRDFRDDPPANLVRGDLEMANQEND